MRAKRKSNGSSRRRPIAVGDDGRARLEKDLGLDINPATGRAFESQGDFHNLNLGAGGRFHDGEAVPKSRKCAECGALVREKFWGQGFRNCGAFVFQGLKFFVCSECVLKVLHSFPNVRGIVSATYGGTIRRG